MKSPSGDFVSRKRPALLANACTTRVVEGPFAKSLQTPHGRPYLQTATYAQTQNPAANRGLPRATTCPLNPPPCQRLSSPLRATPPTKCGRHWRRTPTSRATRCATRVPASTAPQLDPERHSEHGARYRASRRYRYPCASSRPPTQLVQQFRIQSSATDASTPSPIFAAPHILGLMCVSDPARPTRRS